MITLDDKVRDIHPDELLPNPNCRVMEFDNKFDLLQFLKKNNPIESSREHTDVFYKALGEYKPNEELVEQVKTEVLNNLLKRGIITGTVYEGFKYSKDGDIIDYAKLASGDPMCMMEPIKKYDKWFYELYINMSIPGSVDEEDIEHGAVRLIETIKALESIDIEIKVNIVDYSKNLYNDHTLKDLLVVIPLISHLEPKDYSNMMPFILGNFLRGPLFTIARNSIEEKNKVDSGMGQALKLGNAVNLWELRNDGEIELATRIMKELGIEGVV